MSSSEHDMVANVDVDVDTNTDVDMAIDRDVDVAGDMDDDGPCIYGPISNDSFWPPNYFISANF
jgi:hypothetical protein